MLIADERQLYLRQRFIDFLDSSLFGNYHKVIEDLIESNERRLAIDLNALRQFSSDLATGLLREPGDYLLALKQAVEELVGAIDPKFLGHGDIHVTLTGGFGYHRISPRELLSPFLGKVVSVEGVITKCSCVRPKVARTTHFCEATGSFITREYRDSISTTGAPTTSIYPTRDQNGNLLTTEFGLCSYRDHQTLGMQEMPENSPAGQLPRSVDVILEDDLVDACKPGDRVSVVGIYKAIPAKSMGSGITGVFRTVLVALSVYQLSKEVAAPALNHEDIQNINELPRRMNPDGLLELLGRSFAPSICGHEEIKKALVLLLFGGTEKNLLNGTHIRGDINCLMVGDPSVAKSQLLRCVMGVAAYAVSTTGRGSSGVGLTAAVTTDQESGERKLEAGAMVLADRGVVCIDEFDKMNDSDRVAIHEVMEQQTVTIAKVNQSITTHILLLILILKGGIHASLNARCSVVAAANPIYGSYDHSHGITRNINLPDSLLSRFDMLFIVLDRSDSKVDRAISSHVLDMHSRENPSLSTKLMLQRDVTLAQGKNELESSMYMSHGALGEVLSKRFLQKYIYYAKHRPWEPTLTPGAENFIAEQYSRWRVDKATESRARRTLPITARTLETMIRLSTAHAKMRISKSVDVVDASVAIDIMRFVVEAEGLTVDKTNGTGPEYHQKDEVTALSRGSLAGISMSKFLTFQKKFQKLMQHREAIQLQDLHEETSAWKADNQFTTEEIGAALNHMQALDKLMMHNDTIHLI